MKHVDPASDEFEALTKVEQARIYHANGWDLPSLMDEFGMTEQTIKIWLNPALYERKKVDTARKNMKFRARHPDKKEEAHRNWLETEQGMAAVARYVEKRRNKKQGS